MSLSLATSSSPTVLPPFLPASPPRLLCHDATWLHADQGTPPLTTHPPTHSLLMCTADRDRCVARVDVARANAVCVCAVVIRGAISAGGGRLPASCTPRADDPRCGARSRWPLQASDVVRSRLSPQVPLLSPLPRAPLSRAPL